MPHFQNKIRQISMFKVFPVYNTLFDKTHCRAFIAVDNDPLIKQGSFNNDLIIACFKLILNRWCIILLKVRRLMRFGLMRTCWMFGSRSRG